jgi:hypothetical protein
MLTQTTRTTLDRNPDINLDKEAIPAGLHLVEGKNLMGIARVNRIPYGVANAMVGIRRTTIGIVLRPEHVDPFLAAQAAHEAKKNAR